MPVKSVIDIDVNDEDFKEFQVNFEKYQKQLTKTPAAWHSVSKETKAINDAFMQMTAALLAQGDAQQKGVKAQRESAKASKDSAVSWGRIASSAKETSAHIYRSTTNLLRWTGIASAFSGLLGAGTIWGLERLASSAANARRSSTGLGLTFGQQQAFGVTFGRVVDPGSFLGGVSQAKGNIASPAAAALYSLGMNPMDGSSNGQTAVDALSKVRGLTKQTPDEQLGILHQTRQLGELGLSLEDLRRIKSLTDEDFEKYKTDYASRASDLNVTDPALKKWQDLNVQLDAAGAKLKAVFIEGLSAVAVPLGKLSEGLADVVKSLLGSRGFKDVIDWIAGGLHKFAEYIGKDEFKRDVKDFVDAISQLAKKSVEALRWLGLIPDGSSGGPPAAPITFEEFKKQNPDRYSNQRNEKTREDMLREDYNNLVKRNDVTIRGKTTPPTPGGAFRHNPGSLMHPSSRPGNYIPMQFSSEEEGLRAQADLLRRYQNQKGNNTLRDIIVGNERHPGYVGPENNGQDRATYLRNVAQWTGYDPDQKLDLNDTATLARVMAAFNRMEGHNPRNSTPEQVRVVIENNTGGSAVVSTSQLGSMFPQ